MLLKFLLGSQLRTWALKNLYFSPHIIMVIKSRNVKCERHVARMDEIGNTNKSSVEMSKNKITSVRPNYRWQKKTTEDI